MAVSIFNLKWSISINTVFRTVLQWVDVTISIPVNYGCWIANCFTGNLCRIPFYNPRCCWRRLQELRMLPNWNKTRTWIKIWFRVKYRSGQFWNSNVCTDPLMLTSRDVKSGDCSPRGTRHPSPIPISGRFLYKCFSRRVGTYMYDPIQLIQPYNMTRFLWLINWWQYRWGSALLLHGTINSAFFKTLPFYLVHWPVKQSMTGCFVLLRYT